VEKPVHLCGPRAAVRLAELTLEIVERVALLFAVHLERVADVADVVERLQLWNAARQHHRQQSDKDVGVLAQTQVSLAAQLHEPAKKQITALTDVPRSGRLPGLNPPSPALDLRILLVPVAQIRYQANSAFHPSGVSK